MFKITFSLSVLMIYRFQGKSNKVHKMVDMKRTFGLEIILMK